MGEPSTKEPRLDEDVAGKTNPEREPVPDSKAEQSPGTMRKKHRLLGDRICRVCGDKAVAHNFDVITCESCKTFFRRNARKTQKECAFEGKCQVTVQTRRFCPACRLQKCFDIGMRADMILGEAERQARMEKIVTNRKKRLEAAQKDVQQDNRTGNPLAAAALCQPDSCSDAGLEMATTLAGNGETLFSEMTEFESQDKWSCQDSPPQSPHTSPRPVSSDGVLETIGTDISSMNINITSSVNINTTSSSNVSTTTTSSENDSTASNSNSSTTSSANICTNSSANICTTTNSNITATSSTTRTSSSGSVKRPCLSDGRTRACNFQHVPKSLLPSDPMMYWRLTPDEHNLITQLTVAYQETVLQMPTRPEALTVHMENLSLEMTLSDCDHFATQIISFLKHVVDFRALAIHDQQALLKANAMLCLMLKSSAVFSEERDAWVRGFGEIPVDVFARITQHEDVVQRHASFCGSLKRILKNDHAAYVLLNCIVLFEPQAANVLDRRAVNILQDKYWTVLKHYLESQYSYVFATQYQEALQDSILQGKTLSVDMTVMFSKWKDILQPLMLEIMNLT